MRLLNTRPKEDALSLTRALEAMGHEVVSTPLLQIEDVDSPLPDLAGVCGLLATSANGLRAFAHKSNRRDIRVYAVGDATARTASEMGFIDVATATGDVQALAALVKAKCKPGDGTLLHVAGTKVAGDLGGDLGGAGYDVQRLVLYRASVADELPEKLKKLISAGDVDGVLLYSPRTATTFVALVQAAGLEKACATADVWCLSPAVADKVRNLPWRNIHTSRRPEQATLLDMLSESTSGDTLDNDR
jgi:uroporphyrinogen-III synthase